LWRRTRHVGGKAKNKAFGPPPKKHPVFALVERGGKASARSVPDVTAKTLRDVLVTSTYRTTFLMTDESTSYITVGKEFAAHGTVNHSANEYVRKVFYHTNTVESFFALFKRGVYGTFHNISEAHLDRYLAEFVFRHNTRTIDDAERCDELLRGAKGKRLMYRQPDKAAHA
jgi:hypothetical protein